MDGIEEVDDDADRNDRSGGIRASLKVGSLRTNRRLGGFGYHLIRVGRQTRDWPNFLPSDSTKVMAADALGCDHVNSE